MFVRTFAGAVAGIDAVAVTVEVNIAGGGLGMYLVGLPDNAVKESEQRIRAAFENSGERMSGKKVVVSLAPADLRKEGSGFDLPIAVGILAAIGRINAEAVAGTMFVCELSLDGSLKPVRGVLPVAVRARSEGLRRVVLPAENAAEAAVVDGIEVIGATTLRQVVGYLNGEAEIAPAVPADDEPFAAASTHYAEDFADVWGQTHVNRALEIAAAGGHNVIMVGAPGSGKTMLARRMTGILHELSVEDQQEALCIHSVFFVNIDGLLAGHRPFRSPHHSISTAGLIGGGRPVHPGEISLAHGGVLFLDELAEFPTGVLQTLRQPNERGYVRIVRVGGAFTFPSRFQLLAASNPCPCGFLGDREVPCRCSAAMVERYRSKLRGPLADRIDMMIDVTRPDPQVIIEGAEGMSSAELRDYVVRGRAFRAWRESRMDDADAEAEDDETRSIDGVVSTFELDDAAEKCVLGLSKRTHLTGRGIVRLVRIARTIADVAESEQVTQDHVLEAAMYQGRRDQ